MSGPHASGCADDRVESGLVSAATRRDPVRTERLQMPLLAVGGGWQAGDYPGLTGSDEPGRLIAVTEPVAPRPGFTPSMALPAPRPASVTTVVFWVTSEMPAGCRVR
jgi:hypothetical protein